MNWLNKKTANNSWCTVGYTLYAILSRSFASFCRASPPHLASEPGLEDFVLAEGEVTSVQRFQQYLLEVPFLHRKVSLDFLCRPFDLTSFAAHFSGVQLFAFISSSCWAKYTSHKVVPLNSRGFWYSGSLHLQVWLVPGKNTGALGTRFPSKDWLLVLHLLSPDCSLQPSPDCSPWPSPDCSPCPSPDCFPWPAAGLSSPAAS